VRELFGVLSAQGAHGGFVVTGGKFSREAQAFADSCGLKLRDGMAIEKLLGGILFNSAADAGDAVSAPSAAACPRCGSPMIERKAEQGKFVGKPFGGCQQYPKCPGNRINLLNSGASLRGRDPENGIILGRCKPPIFGSHADNFGPIERYRWRDISSAMPHYESREGVCFSVEGPAARIHTSDSEGRSSVFRIFRSHPETSDRDRENRGCYPRSR
jgi:hypothetical protein